MGFRERPEYQDWRDAVLRLFGQKCIRCGHAGNIHAHHVMPVNEYPELVFEPTNGVPLCGNCHTEIKGNELAHLDDLKRRQRAILGGETARVAGDGPSESVLRERAYAEPSNAEAVQAWFELADARAVNDFYNQHREDSTQTAFLCGRVAGCLTTVGRWQDVIAVADKAMDIAEREGALEESVGEIASAKSDAFYNLGRQHEAVAFLFKLISRFPRVANLRYVLSTALFEFFTRWGNDGQIAINADLLEESLRQALKAIDLAPGECSLASWASFLLAENGDFASALRYGKRALALASTDDGKIEALRRIARVYMDNSLHADARSYLREALQLDDCNVGVIGCIALCYRGDGNDREALRMANRGLMLDPQNELCGRICSELAD